MSNVDNRLSKEARQVAQRQLPQDYQLRDVLRQQGAQVFRAHEKAGDRPVVLKTLPQGLDGARAALSIEQEYQITQALDTEYVIRSYGLTRVDDRLLMVLEDFGGDALDRLRSQGPLPVPTLLKIAIQVTKGLIHIHGAGIIHKDISPANIVYNPDSGIAKIIDFGISTQLTREQADMALDPSLDGSLPYMSPEQTGRMNRAIDYRTDFYSLGATLYELFTGSPLFAAKDALEWLHAHIALQPVAACKRNPDVPEAVSNILMKLLEKNAENRYQSAEGLLADLEQCLTELEATGSIQPFALGQHDKQDQLHLQQRLYGREAQLDRLLTIFDRVSQGAAELVLVAGYSGIGKTCLVKELYKPITSQRGFFISGKFDQLHRAQPYSALIHALQGLLRQLLTLPEEQLTSWRELLHQQLGENLPLIASQLSGLDLELITGPLSSQRLEASADAERHMRRVLASFIRLFASAEHPLVIFIDDLQWADSATLHLLGSLLDPRHSNHLMVIGAYRDNEVTPGHALLTHLQRIRETGVAVETLQLQPLQLPDVAAMVADALSTEPTKVWSLAELVYAKAAGNPFFTEEFLKHLHSQKLLQHDGNQWQFDLEGIRGAQITDNVVDLMQTKLQRLPLDTQTLLQLAACIGNKFALQTLLLVAERPAAEVTDALRDAITQGLIAPLGDAYQLLQAHRLPLESLTLSLAFAHDRIQQAAYQTLNEAERQANHARIGQLLLAQNADLKTLMPALCFQISDHLNRAQDLLRDRNTLTQLCRLNLTAGRFALDAAAFQVADDYMQKALRLSAQLDPEQDRDLLLVLSAEAAKAALLVGDTDRCDALTAQVLPLARNILERTPLHVVQLRSMVQQGKLKEALNLGKPLLNKLGGRFPRRTKARHIMLGYWRIRWRLRRYDLQRLLSLPEMTDPLATASARISDELSSAAPMGEPMFLVLLAYRGVRHILEDGVGDRTTLGLAGMAALMYRFGDYEQGAVLAQASRVYLERYPSMTMQARVAAIEIAFIHPLKVPFRDIIKYAEEQAELASNVGRFDDANQLLTYKANYGLTCGLPLPTLMEDFSHSRQTLLEVNQREGAVFIALLLQYITNLSTESARPEKLIGELYNIDLELPKYMAQGEGGARIAAWAMILQSQLSYHFGHYASAAAEMNYMRPHFRIVDGLFDGAIMRFYDSLVRLAAYDGAKPALRQKYLRQIKRNLPRLRPWTRFLDGNFGAKVKLIEAELARVEQDQLKAQALYDEAVELARIHANLSDEALALERAGHMYLQFGRKTAAEAYLRKARAIYQRWGALAKVRFLEVQYADVLESTSLSRDGSLTRSITTSGSTTNSSQRLLNEVDMSTLMRALKAIAQEQVHSRMIRMIIDTAMTFAGAQKGLLVLRDIRNRFCIEAEASVDTEQSRILQSIPVARGIEAPSTLINLIARTSTAVVLDDASSPSSEVPGLDQDPYIKHHQVKSVLCLPIITGIGETQELLGMLYLENNRTLGGFTDRHFSMLEIIAIGAAGRLELSRKAAVDSLTQLYNRGYFQNMLRQEVAAAQRSQRPLCLLLADIDRFKEFNDTWGHQLGDEVLRMVANTLKQACREADVVARYGGEELAVILPETDITQAMLVAERIRAQVAALEVMHQDKPLQVTISIGVSQLQLGQTDAALVTQTDEALYDAKHGGRDQVRQR